MLNKGYGWSKAIARAAETLEHDNADTDRPTTEGRRPGDTPLVGKSVPTRE